MSDLDDPVVTELYQRTAEAQQRWVTGDAGGYEALFSPHGGVRPEALLLSNGVVEHQHRQQERHWDEQ